MPHSRCIRSLLISLTLCASVPALAHHAGGHPTRYVSEGGVDDGACTDATRPCRSLGYAFAQASKGDQVHIAVGTYRVDEGDLFYLIGEMIQIRGGYDATGWQKTSEAARSTLTGVPAQFREQLASRGFRIIQDRKNPTSVSPQTAANLATWRRLQQPAIQGFTACVNGMAGDFPCNDFDLQSRVPLSAMSLSPASANDIWGFVDLNDNREYAILGVDNGTVVFDVTDPAAPVEVGAIPGQSSVWRDVKVYQYFDATSQRYKAYAYVTTEASEGLQIIDLSNLPQTVTLANTLTDFLSAHNVYVANVDYATGLANEVAPARLYIAGANVDGGAFRVFSLADPTNPTLMVAAPSGAGYMHDVTSMIITDNRTQQCANGHNPCEVLVDYDENAVDLWDVTDPGNPVKLSSTGYPSSGYVHSGWWSRNRDFVFVQDELDEQQHGLNTTLRVLDISDLTQPVLAGQYVGPTKAIDHNGFALGDRYYMSNYRRGLTVLDISDPANPAEVGFFDTFPVPADNTANFDGAWGTYPYLPSGNILISDIQNGLFVVKEVASGAVPDPQTPSTPPAASSGGGGTMGWLMFLLVLLQPERQSIRRRRTTKQESLKIATT
jgi:choice-of-anchor B domain-containing protein